MTQTIHQIHSIYRAAQAEVASVFNRPDLLDLPLKVTMFPPMEDSSLAVTSFGFGIPSDDKKAEIVMLNKAYAFLMDEDEVRYALIHELVHAVHPFSEGHGSNWQADTFYLTGYPEPTMDIRRETEVDTFSAMLLGLSPDYTPHGLDLYNTF